jgi:hypothetical protein
VSVPAAPSVRRAVALLTLAAAGAGAQPSAAVVPPDDPTYALLDELGALIPLPGLVVGQRPYSRREVVRLARAACAVLARDTAAASGSSAASPSRRRAAALVAAVLGAHERHDLGAESPAINEGLGDPCRDSPVRPRRLATRLEALAISVVGSSFEPRPVPRDNGIGSIAAVSNPALDARGGRPIVEGGALSLESVHTLGAGGWLAVVAQPRVSLVTSPDGGTRWEAVPQRLSGRLVWRNVALGAGLEPRQWGLGGARSLFLSTNALPLPAVSIASDTAFRLPWLLRGLGRVRAELLVADLGRGREFPHAKLAAYKLDLAPAAWLEIGTGLMSQMGGRGAPPLDLEGRVRDLAPFVFWLVDEGSDPIATNKVANAQLRVRIPQLRSASLAWELAVDDFDLRRIRRMLWEDTGHLVALTLPRLRDDGSLAFDAQWHRTSLRLYQHYQYTDGLAYRGRILGSPLGPATTAGYATMTWRPAVRTTWRLQLGHEVRDSSQWRSRVVNAEEDGFDFVRVDGDGVKESRSRASLEGRLETPGAGRGWFARGGFERAQNLGFARGRSAELRPFVEAGAVLRF